MKVLQNLVLILCFTGLIYSQSNKTFKLKGTVYDINRARVVGTEILVKNKDEKVFKTRTNDSGEYEIILPIGSYNVEFTTIGFKTLIVNGLTVNSEIKKDLDVTLEVGRCEDCNGAIYGERWDDLAVLSGYVYDSNGAVIENAEITFRDFDNRIRQIKTNIQGRYYVSIHNGNYSIEVEAAGFKKFKVDRYLAVGTQKGLSLDIVLEVKSCDDPTMNCLIVPISPTKSN